MKKTLSLLALLLVSLAVTSTLSAQVNIQKTQGTNAVSNGNIVIGTGTTLSTSGTGAITATAFSGSGTVAVANGGTGVTTSTGTGSTVLSASPTFTGTLTAANLTATGTTTLATSLTGILKATSGVVSTATSGTDYLPSTGGTGVTTLGTITTGVWNGTAIAVANGGTGSTTATAAQRALTPATSTVTTGASPAVNWSLSNSFDLTLTSATAATISFSNAQDGQVITITIHQPASGTATTVTWPTMKWSGGTAPTMTATLGKTDVFTIYYNATASAYYGSAVQNF